MCIKSESRVPGAHIWSPMFEIGISTLQFEHFIVGKKLEARVENAILAFHLLPPVTRRNVLGQNAAIGVYAASCPQRSRTSFFPVCVDQ